MEASEGARAAYAKGLGQEGLDKAIMAIAEGVGARAEITRHVSHPRRPAGLTRHLPTPSPCLTVMPGWAGLCQRLSNGMGGLRTREKENAREAGRAKALDAKKMGVWSPGFEACEPGEGCLHLRSTREGRRLLVGRGP